ncbi:MAG: hypothetical protein HC934_00820 [Acaryochloridaceae cyanobacterium SU_2_1]|nr:hypothetical protein [Acaryochloridaceae cyanobacterium SU_2_1]
MLSESQQDGHLLVYAAAPPMGRSKRLIHVNGVTSPVEKQLEDLETLVWLTLEHPLDIVGVHNSTSGYRSDLLESMMGKAELVQFWPEYLSAESDKRLQRYADLLGMLCDRTLAPDADILAELQQQRRPPKAFSTANPQSTTDIQTTGTPSTLPQLSFDLDMIRRLPFLQNMAWDDFESYLYGHYPAGAPRPILRLAYEVVQSIRAGAEVFIVAHSEGTIIAALALQILQRFFGTYPKWSEPLRCIFYGPAIMPEDLPPMVRTQTIFIQHRHDLVAEAFSNLRHVDLWTNLQSQVKVLMERADTIFTLAAEDSYHSARHYLGQLDNPDSQRAAQLLKLLLTEDWQRHSFLNTLSSARLILETIPS